MTGQPESSQDDFPPQVHVHGQREWWSPREVAELYHVHITTIYRWIEIGKLPAVRMRRNIYRIRWEDVAALAEKPEHPEGVKKELPLEKALDEAADIRRHLDREEPVG